MTGSERRGSAVYIDTSVFGRVILEEPGRDAIHRELARFERRVASRLLGLELRRVGRREDALLEAERILESVTLFPVDEAILAFAESIAPRAVGTLDAIHLATAVRLAEAEGLEALMTYDKQLARGAEEHEITVISPS